MCCLWAHTRVHAAVAVAVAVAVVAIASACNGANGEASEASRNEGAGSFGVKGGSGARSTMGRKNVLYIVYDDLRPDISAFGASYMKTPNIDKLALSEGSVLFNRAYCQQSVCSPSRMSFTTGRRPNTTQAWNFLNHFRQADCAFTKGVVYDGIPVANTRLPNGTSFTGDSVGMTGEAAKRLVSSGPASPLYLWWSTQPQGVP